MPTTEDRKTGLQIALEKSVLNGLACEWQNAIGILEDDIGSQMKLPVFRLKDMSSRLGYWSAEKREICLSRNLTFRHSWDSVKEVLLHEMAHQLTDTILGGSDTRPHGHFFRKACRMLRANPSASGGGIPLDEAVSSGRFSKNDKILAKIAKLMALAESGNRHEAETAMSKAHLLLAKHNVSWRRENNPGYFSVHLGKPALRHFREVYHLAALLQDFYFVSGIWIPAYVVEKERMGHVLEISGLAANIETACYIHDFIMRHIDKKWSDYNKNNRLNRYRKTDFSIGVVEGFREKMIADRVSQQSQWKRFEIVLSPDPGLTAYMNYHHPRTRSYRRQATHQNEAVLNDGWQVGRKMIISKGISDSRNSHRRLTGS